MRQIQKSRGISGSHRQDWIDQNRETRLGKDASSKVLTRVNTLWLYVETSPLPLLRAVLTIMLALVGHKSSSGQPWRLLAGGVAPQTFFPGQSDSAAP